MAAKAAVRPVMTSVVTRGPDERASGRVASRSRKDRHLLVRYHCYGDASAREELVERFMPLARKLARRYQRGNEPIDDLVQVASMGLVKAVDRFDLTRGTAFTTYAVPTIVGELKRFIRDSAWALHVPRRMQERAMQLQQATAELNRRLGRTPSTSELAVELDLTTEDVLMAMEAASAFESASLDEEYNYSDDSREPAYAAALRRDDERLELVEDVATIAPGLTRLAPRERLILRLRFVDELTQYEIAERIGISQMQVCRLLRRTLAELRFSTTGGCS